MQIRDLIYFDLERAWSLFSQLEGGLVTETQETSSSERDERNVRKYNLKVFQPEFGGVETERVSALVVRELHHDVLRIIEERLSEERMLVEVPGEEADFDTLRSRIAEFPYVRAEGWVSVEDFRQIDRIAASYDDLSAFISRCAAASVEATPGFVSLTEQIADARAKLEAEPDPKKKLNAERRLATLEQNLAKEIASMTDSAQVDEWLLSGIRKFIDAFMRDRILLRLFPLGDTPGFQLLGNLKRDCFIDGDISVFQGAYGLNPNVQLTAFGLVTSCPRSGGLPFDPMAAPPTLPSDAERADFESGFRELFSAFESLHSFMSFLQFPNVGFLPLAVYRTVRAGGGG